MGDKEQSTGETEAPPVDCPHGRSVLKDGIWKCTRCNEPVSHRPTRTFTTY